MNKYPQKPKTCKCPICGKDMKANGFGVETHIGRKHVGKPFRPYHKEAK